MLYDTDTIKGKGYRKIFQNVESSKTMLKGFYSNWSGWCVLDSDKHRAHNIYHACYNNECKRASVILPKASAKLLLHAHVADWFFGTSQQKSADCLCMANWSAPNILASKQLVAIKRRSISRRMYPLRQSQTS